MSEQYLRTFIAVDLPEHLKARLARLNQKLVNQIKGVCWVRPNNMHLTLCFLGDTKPETIPQVQQILDGVAREQRPFTLYQSQLTPQGAIYTALHTAHFA